MGRVDFKIYRKNYICKETQIWFIYSWVWTFYFNIKATIGVNIHILDFMTNKGKVNFHVWDTAGQEKFGGLRDGYYIGAHCGIVLFDLSNRTSYKTIPIWYRDIERFWKNIIRICGEINIAVVGNKLDIKEYEEDDERLLNFRR